MNETTPQVDLIARPSVDLEALGRYLKTVGGEGWLERRLQEEDGANPGQLLVEAAGRACYRSWEPGLNPNVTRVRSDQAEYFLNILRSGHGSVLEHANYTFVLSDVSRVFCYDDETEVLTDIGWIPWPKVEGTETFATLDPDSGEIEYQKATERFLGEYVGPMYRVSSEHVDLLVTPNHRMWVRRPGDEGYGIHTAKEIASFPVSYQKTGRWRGGSPAAVTIASPERNERSFPARPLARLLGYYRSCGAIEGDRVTLTPRPAGGGMVEAARAAGLEPMIGAGGEVTVQAADLAAFLAAAGPTRVPTMVGAWAPDLIAEFLAATLEAGGSGVRREIEADSAEAADELQVLALKAGWAADVRVEMRGLHPRHVVSLVEHRPVVNDDAADDAFVPYEGRIHCVKVPNGLLFVRRNGKAVVSGNTHELVRHRAGSAFSQESMRFVRIKDMGFRIPEAISSLRPQIISILETLEEFQIAAADHFGLDDQGVSFHTKKEITSALRRLAPEGISTMIIWTANVRTLRHVIQARTDPGAEEELRSVFNRVGEIMTAEAPLLFGDFEVVDGAWVTQHKKV